MRGALAARSGSLAGSLSSGLAGWLAGWSGVGSLLVWVDSAGLLVCLGGGGASRFGLRADLTSRSKGFFFGVLFCGFLFPDVLAGIFGDWSFRRSWSWLTNLQALLIIVTLLWLAFWGTSPWNTTPPIGKIDKRMSPCLGFCG